MSKKKNIWQGLEEVPIIENVIGFFKRYSLPGCSGVPMYDVAAFIYNEAMKDDISTRANSIAFSFFLSLFPTIIFLFTLLPLLPVTADYVALLDSSLEGILPDSAHSYLFGIIEGVASIKRSGLLSLGFFLAIFFASSGVLTMMYGFDKAYATTFKQRGYFKKRWVAFMLTLVLGGLLILSMIFIILGKPLLGLVLDSADLSGHTSFILKAVRWLVVVFIIYLGITIIYRYGPSMYKRTKFWNPGSVVACSLSILSSIAFSYFINNFGRYNELYGSIGALIVIMLWMQINAYILLIGFELNTSIAVNRDLRKA